MDLRASGLKSLDSGTSFEAHPPEHNHRLHNALQPLPGKQQWKTQWTRTHQLASSKQMPLKCIFISCFYFASHFLLEGWKSCVTKYPKQRYKIIRKKGGYVRTEVGGRGEEIKVTKEWYWFDTLHFRNCFYWHYVTWPLHTCNTEIWEFAARATKIHIGMGTSPEAPQLLNDRPRIKGFSHSPSTCHFFDSYRILWYEIIISAHQELPGS